MRQIFNTISLNPDYKEHIVSTLKKHGIPLSRFVKELVENGYYQHVNNQTALDLTRKAKALHSSLDQYGKFITGMDDSTLSARVEKVYRLTRSDLDAFVKDMAQTVPRPANQTDEIYTDFAEFREFVWDANRDQSAPNQYRYFLQFRLKPATEILLREAMIRNRQPVKNQYLLQLISNAEIYTEAARIQPSQYNELIALFDSFNDAIRDFHASKKEGRLVTDKQVIAVAQNELKAIRDFTKSTINTRTQ